MKDDIFEHLKKEVSGVQKNVPLKDHTTFKIGGPAEYFFVASNQEDVLQAIEAAKRLKLPVFVLGGGSNLLVSDKGFKGLVIKIQSKESIRLKGPSIIEAPTGARLGGVVDFSISNSLKGLEWAGGLPGTFGGAIRGNAGAFGGEIKDTIFEVKALANNFKVKKFDNKGCKFSYRNSIFKEKGWTILSASVKLQKGVKEELEAIADSRKQYRNERHPLEYPNAGSIFKNIDFKKVPKAFHGAFRDKVKQDPFPIVPAAWFIIGAGLVGKKVGQAQISEKHSNYIVNLGGAKAEDVVKLIELVKKEVKKTYSISLEVEVQLVGF